MSFSLELGLKPTLLYFVVPSALHGLPLLIIRMEQVSAQHDGDPLLGIQKCEPKELDLDPQVFGENVDRVLEVMKERAFLILQKCTQEDVSQKRS